MAELFKNTPLGEPQPYWIHMPLPDLEDALASFKRALKKGEISLRPCESDLSLFMHVDRPTGDEMRMTYARLQGNDVTVMISVLPDRPYEGKPCFGLGCAVPQRFRGRGRAAEATVAVMKEMRQGFAKAGITSFYVEAVISIENVASQRTAAKAIAHKPVAEDIDKDAGVPVVQYVRLVEADTDLDTPA